MKQDFTGYNNDTIVVEYEEMLVSSSSFIDALKDTKVDLTPEGMEKACKFYFIILPMLSTTGQPDDPNAMFRMGWITCKGKTLLALCRGAVDVFMKQMVNKDVAALSQEPNFDCDMAAYMSVVYQAIVGERIEQDFMPLGPVQFMGLLNVHPQVGSMIASVIEAYYKSMGKKANADSYAVAMPEFDGRQFFAAQVPEGCAKGAIKPVGDKEETTTSSKWLAPVAVVVAVGGVGALWWAMSRKPQLQAPRAVR